MDTLYTGFWIVFYIVFLITFFWVIFLAVSRRFRNKREHEERYSLTFMQIKLPRENEVEIKAAEQMFSGLIGIKKPFWGALFTGQHRVSFEIVSKAEGIGFYVVTPDSLAGLVEKQINGAYPDAEIDIVDPSEVWDRGAYTSVMELRLAGPSYYPIKVYENMGSDTMSGITSVMSKLEADEALAIQLVISPSGEAWRNHGYRFIGNVKAAQANPEKSSKVDATFIEGVEKEVAKPGFDVAIRVISLAKDKITADSHLQNVHSAFEQFTNPKYNKFKQVSFMSSQRIVDDFIFRRLDALEVSIPAFDIPLYRNTSLLNIEELATVFHFPNKNVQTPKIMWLQSRKSAAPSNAPKEGMYLGKNIFRGVETKIHLKPDDRRRHTYIIGQTGTGKSQLLMYMAVQDIVAGHGVCVIDPHGTDIDDILKKIPPERMDDVILFDVSDTTRPLGLNILEAEDDDQRNMIINSFIGLLYKLYDPNHSGIIGPQLERAVRNIMLTAMVDPESTMIDVLRLVIDGEYIKKFLPKIKDPLVKRYWTDEMAKTSDFHKSEKVGYFVSKFDRFVTEKVMRNIIGQPKSALNFPKIMAEKKILLVDLSKGKIGEENSNFLGLILVPRILSAAMARHTLIGKEDFPDFYLYVDEFQNFATPDFATILSEARKYKLNLIVANQFIAQLTDDIKNAVFGNVGTTMAFRVGADDAEYLETQFAPFTKADLINNTVGNYYMKLLVNGQPTPPFSVNINWEEIQAVKKYPGVDERLREMSRMKYGVPVEEVDKYINLRAGFGDEFETKDPRDIIKELF